MPTSPSECTLMTEASIAPGHEQSPMYLQSQQEELYIADTVSLTVLDWAQ